MHKSSNSQRARTRARLRKAPANDNAGAAPETPPQPAPLEAAVVVPIFPREEEPPFDPPDPAELLGLGDCDEEDTIFVTANDATAEAEAPAEAAALTPELEPAPEPELDLIVEAPPEPEPEAPAARAEEDESLPFDAPDESDEIFGAFEHAPAPAPEPAPQRAPKPLSAAPRPEAPEPPPLPPVRVHLSWDNSAAADMFAALAADRRCANAALDIGRGGIDGAAARFAVGESPDLIVLETNLRGADMLAALDRLAEVLAPGVRVIVLAAVNDVTLLRELSARGVSEYLIAPVGAEALARAMCRQFADTDKSRVIAVVGARGGVGASTLAFNLAWSIAERQQRGAALLDLDLPFGAAAFAPEQRTHSIADALAQDADAALDDVVTCRSPRLRVLPAPSGMDLAAADPDLDAVQRLIARARRMSPYVLLDLPHVWAPWVKHTLLAADEIIVVAAPDLASLRNADNMLKLLRSEASRNAAPVIVLSMAGVPKRPEIAAKDFSEALMSAPVATFAFDPALFAGAAMNHQAIGEAAPAAKAARQIDELATHLTGHEPVAPARRAPQAEAPPAPVAAPAADAPLDLTVRAEDPPVQEEDAPPLDLIEPAPEPAPDRFAEARRVAALELQAMQPARKPRRRSSGLLRVAAAVALLVTTTAWYAQYQNEPASAAEATMVTPRPPEPGAAERYAQALTLIEAGQADAGVDELRRLADHGFALAQYRLAKLHERGEHVGADLAVAREFTERAAAGGNVLAMHDLGVYFARGEGAAADLSAAFRWFRLAAEYDVADSQYNLGVLYQQGRGVAANPQEALFWFLLAARHGDEGVGEHIAALEAELLELDIEQARARAQAFRPQTPNAAANTLNPPASP